MRIEIKKLIALKKFTGSFGFDYTPSEDMCLIPLCKIDGDVKVSGDFEIYDDDSVGVNLKVSYKISGQCSYCLAPAEKRVEFTSEILYVPVNDDENYIYDGVKIDLKSAVDDAILISQPNIILCKDDCKGMDVE